MAQRIQIRDEIGRLLSHIDGIDHVAVGRFKPLEVSRCPFVRVLADSETGELYSDAGQERRTLSLQIEIYVDDSDDPEAEANEIATLIEKQLCRSDSYYLSGLLTEPLSYQGYELTADDAPDRETAAAVLQYEAVYLFEPNVSGDGVPLKRVCGDIDVGDRDGPDGKAEAQFRVEDLYPEGTNG